MKILLSLVQILLIAACVVGYVRIATGKGALRRSARVWTEAFGRPAMRTMIWLWIGIFVIDLVQTATDLQTDDYWPYAWHQEFQQHIHLLEGTVVAALQRLLAFPPLTHLLSLAYLILFPAILFASASIYDRLDDHARTRMVAYVYGLNYLICLPFYILMPVREPWTLGGSDVVLMIDLHSFAPLIDVLRPMSGLDNCFPSYHTSLTVSLVLIAYLGGPRKFARAIAVTGFLIVLSTLYLGFHWLSDVVAGVIAGAVAFAWARKLALAHERASLTLDESAT